MYLCGSEEKTPQQLPFSLFLWAGKDWLREADRVFEEDAFKPQFKDIRAK